MNRRTKILLGLAAFSPWFAISHFLLAITFGVILTAFLPQQKVDAIYPFLIFPSFVSWGIMMVASMIASIVFTHHFRSQNIPVRQRLKWILFSFIWPISMPIYWYHYIWREHKLISEAEESVMNPSNMNSQWQPNKQRLKIAAVCLLVACVFLKALEYIIPPAKVGSPLTVELFLLFLAQLSLVAIPMGYSV